MIHHVSPGGHFHAAHIGPCDDRLARADTIEL